MQDVPTLGAHGPRAHREDQALLLYFWNEAWGVLVPSPFVEVVVILRFSHSNPEFFRI